MGTIILHVGMPKTGSTSIQTWIRRAAETLHDRHHIQVMCDSSDPAAGAEMVPYEGDGRVATLGVPLRLQAAIDGGATVAQQRKILEPFTASLDAAAHLRSTVLATSELFSTLLIRGDEPFLESLAALSASHTVRIVCYLRPQHSAIVSRWRQWGWLGDPPPAEWVQAQSGDLDYHEWLTRAGTAAPLVVWDLRPYRRDLMVGNDVVTDFAETLGEVPVADAGSDDAPNDNPGLPLDLVIALRNAPASLTRTPGAELPGRMDVGLRQRNIGLIVRDWQFPESPEARRSREIVHTHAWSRYEASNAALIAESGWNTPTFIDRPDDTTLDIGELDGLWQPPRSITHDYLYAALTQLLERLERTPQSG